MSKGIVLTPAQFQKVARVVNKYDGKSYSQGQGEFTPHGPTSQTYIWAEITGSSGVSGTYYHSWTQQIRTASGFSGYSGYSGTTSLNSIVAPDGSQIPNNTVVAAFVNLPTGFSGYSGAYYTAVGGSGGSLSIKPTVIGQGIFCVVDGVWAASFPFAHS